MTDRIRNILQSLERVREDLLALSGDIWLSIDHNDNDAMQEGVAFKRKFNERLATLDGRPTARAWARPPDRQGQGHHLSLG